MHIDPHHAPGLSRRDFLRTSSFSAAALPVFAALPADAAPIASAASADLSFAPSPDLLATARSTAQWIDSARREDARGVWWLPDPDHPEHETTVSAPNALYSGSAGTVLFFLQLADATGESAYRERAVQAHRILRPPGAVCSPSPRPACSPGRDSISRSMAGSPASPLFCIARPGPAAMRDFSRRAAMRPMRSSRPRSLPARALHGRAPPVSQPTAASSSTFLTPRTSSASRAIWTPRARPPTASSNSLRTIRAAA